MKRVKFDDIKDALNVDDEGAIIDVIEELCKEKCIYVVIDSDSKEFFEISESDRENIIQNLEQEGRVDIDDHATKLTIEPLQMKCILEKFLQDELLSGVFTTDNQYFITNAKLIELTQNYISDKGATKKIPIQAVVEELKVPDSVVHSTISLLLEEGKLLGEYTTDNQHFITQTKLKDLIVSYIEGHEKPLQKIPIQSIAEELDVSENIINVNLSLLLDEGEMLGEFTTDKKYFITQKKLKELTRSHVQERIRPMEKVPIQNFAEELEVQYSVIYSTLSTLIEEGKIQGYIDPKANDFIRASEVRTPPPPPPPPTVRPPPPPPTTLTTPFISVSRGYVRAGQYLKISIKVENLSPTSITDVSVKIVAPAALEKVTPKTNIVDLGVIKPNGSQSAIFQLQPIRCVDDTVTGIVMFHDASGEKMHTEQMKPLEIRSICPMLTGEDVEVEWIMMALQKGKMKSNKADFKFSGDPKVAFEMAESRLKGLIPIDRDVRIVNDHYIAYASYFGRTKYGNFDFATEIRVFGKKEENILTLKVYSDEASILSGYFYDILQDVEKNVKIIEEGIKCVDEICPECGEILDLSKVDDKGYFRCDSCKLLFHAPKWKIPDISDNG